MHIFQFSTRTSSLYLLESLAEDIHMQSSKETQTPALAQSITCFFLHVHRRVAQGQFGNALIKLIKVTRVDGEDASPYHGFCRNESGHGRSNVLVVKEGVADVGFAQCLHVQNEVSDLSSLPIIFRAC